MKVKPDSEEIGVEVVVDVKQSPMVLWYPKTQELEVRVLDMLAAAQYEPADDDSFAELKRQIHERIKEGFESDELKTLVHARVLAFNIILKAAKKGLVIGSGPASMKTLLDKQVLMN